MLCELILTSEDKSSKSVHQDQREEYGVCGSVSVSVSTAMHELSDLTVMNLQLPPSAESGVQHEECADTHECCYYSNRRGI